MTITLELLVTIAGLICAGIFAVVVLAGKSFWNFGKFIGAVTAKLSELNDNIKHLGESLDQQNRLYLDLREEQSKSEIRYKSEFDKIYEKFRVINQYGCDHRCGECDCGCERGA